MTGRWDSGMERREKGSKLGMSPMSTDDRGRPELGEEARQQVSSRGKQVNQWQWCWLIAEAEFRPQQPALAVAGWVQRKGRGHLQTKDQSLHSQLGAGAGVKVLKVQTQGKGRAGAARRARDPDTAQLFGMVKAAPWHPCQSSSTLRGALPARLGFPRSSSICRSSPRTLASRWAPEPLEPVSRLSRA